jgi:hypothetical protein
MSVRGANPFFADDGSDGDDVGYGGFLGRSLVNWDLNGCCNEKQIIFLSLVGGYSILIFFTWRLFILKPFKLITVWVHEMGHATACWLTGGKVHGIDVSGDEGGVTKTSGGWQSVILPAGYLGSSLVGMGLVIASVDSVGVEVAAGMLAFGLLVTVYYAESASLRLLVLAFLALVAGMWALQRLTEFDGLEYLILFLGVMNGLYSVYDIYDDLISRRVASSDASKFAQLTHTSSACCGVLWGLISVAFLILGVWIALGNAYY